MDWFSWLSKTGLEPSLVYQYGEAFAENELEEEDISYFNHEFLQSMGISIAKHRLQILKLSAKQRRRGNGRGSFPPMSAILIAVTNHLRALVRRRPREPGLAIVPAGNSARWLVKRSNRKVVAPPRLLLTDGGFNSARINSFSSPYVDDRIDDLKVDDDYWSSAVEDIRWDAMFHNLKPT